MDDVLEKNGLGLFYKFSIFLKRLKKNFWSSSTKSFENLLILVSVEIKVGVENKENSLEISNMAALEAYNLNSSDWELFCQFCTL